MRRRIWHAVVELELQTALTRGMVSAPWPLQSDSAAPANLHDEDFNEHTVSKARPHAEFTKSSYLSIASETVALRHTLNTALNDARQTISHEEVKSFTEQIQSHLRDIPQWNGEGSAVSQALLTITLRQYLLTLHLHHHRNSAVLSEQDYSGVQVIDNSQKIMQAHKALTEEDRYPVQFLCPVALRAALAICYIATTVDLQADSAIRLYAIQSASSIATDAVDIMSESVYRLGNGQQQLWIVLVVDALLKMKKDPDRKLIYMQEASDGMSRPYYKILACQDSVAQSKQSVSVPSLANDTAEPPSAMLHQIAGSAAESWHDSLMPPTPAMWNLEDWPFDEWTFDQINA